MPEATFVVDLLLLFDQKNSNKVFLRSDQQWETYKLPHNAKFSSTLLLHPDFKNPKEKRLYFVRNLCYGLLCLEAETREVILDFLQRRLTDGEPLDSTKLTLNFLLKYEENVTNADFTPLFSFSYKGVGLGYVVVNIAGLLI